MEKNNSFNSRGNPKVRDMLNNLFRLFVEKFKDKEKAWSYLLEFIAIDNSANLLFEKEYNLNWFVDDKRFRDSVLSVYDSNLLKSDYYDHLGEFYFELINEKPITNNLSYNIKNQIRVKSNEKKNSIKVLDLDMGTGRNLMTIHKECPNTILFGVTNNFSLYRIAHTNSLLFGIKCFLLCADIMKHELGLNNDRGITNWKKANQWSYGIGELIQNLKNI